MEQVAMDCEMENKTDVRGYKNTYRVVIKLIACALTFGDVIAPKKIIENSSLSDKWSAPEKLINYRFESDGAIKT